MSEPTDRYGELLRDAREALERIEKRVSGGILNVTDQLELQAAVVDNVRAIVSLLHGGKRSSAVKVLKGAAERLEHGFD